MEHRFRCTACGKCCNGWLPLTLEEAVRHADSMPVAMVWTPIRKGAQPFKLTKRLGIMVRLPDRRGVAVQVMPTAYIPPQFSCPKLTDDGLCGIHDDKPLRCRTMPFFPYLEEADQRNYLIPRAGWACDTSDAAPVVYREKQIVDRGDFIREKTALLNQAEGLRRYAERVLKMNPAILGHLAEAAATPMGGKVILSFCPYLSGAEHLDAALFARRQIPVLRDYAERTAGEPKLADYHRRYEAMAAELQCHVP